MKNKLSQLINWASEFFSSRKGLLPLIGIILIAFNFILRLTISGWLPDSDLLLHLGIIIAVSGIMLSWAL